ncbi:MAG: 3-phosphoshikimate 1-carboxyvinyltransferase [Hyphomicrobiales bacterium]
MSRATVRPGRPLRGEATLPGDKSITQRALLLGALARGTTRIRGANDGKDARAALGIVRALGARVRIADDAWTLEGGALRESERVLDARNSGTALRLSIGLLAAQPFLSVLTGDASLRRRPVDRVLVPLARLGAVLAARDGDRLPPVVVRGTRLRGADVATGVASAQVKSAVLLAAIQAEGATTVEEPAPTRDHTERMLPRFGVPVARDGCRARVEGPATLHGAEIDVPGDPSAAAFLAAAASLTRGSDVLLRDVAANPTRTSFFDRLASLGARVAWSEPRDASGEPVADVRIVHGHGLRPFDVGPEEASALIDELPLLAVLAAFARGTSRIRGARELRVKESDRIAAVAAGLDAIGVRVEAHDDGWTVHGTGAVRGGTVDASGDHRIAMAFLVAGLGTKDGVTVEGAEAAAVSDPGFLARLRRLSR